MKKKILSVFFSTTIVLSLVACTGSGAGTASSEMPTVQPIDVVQASEQQVQSELPSQTETSEQATPAPAMDETKRADGERFESTIIMEGMEEPVQYEHIVNDTLGFEMDYDYENYQRVTDSDKECFVSVYDNADDPWDYLEITYRDQTAEGAIAVVSEELSKEYTIDKFDVDLEKAGTCTKIDASVDLSGTNMPEKLQAVYVIPAGDGCIVATAHYAIESAEGTGRRFAAMMNTLTVTGKTE